jgi:iron(III) transport system substrate-binding protein
VRLLRRSSCLALAAALSVSVLAACSGGPKDPDVLLVYNAQHDDWLKAMTDGFTAETGIDIEVRQGGDADMSNQLVKEGGKTPADVFITENSPAMTLVDSKGMFAPLPASTTDQVPAEFVAKDNAWVGVSRRSTSLGYDPKKVTDFPATMFELATDPKWKGFGYAPRGADFQAITAAMYALKGQEVGDQFVAGLKANGADYANNFAIMQAINAGQLKMGLMYHYYFYKDRNAGGDNSSNVEMHFFGNQDPGAFMSVSGAGVIKGSNKADEAQRLVAYLTSAKGQQALANSGALEYPVGTEVQQNDKLPSLTELDPPTVPIESLDAPAVVEEFRKVGIL